jgi:DNA-binding transcriptional LysR family regulator
MANLQSVDILRQVQNSEIDAGIVHLHGDLPEGVQTVPLYDERHVLLTAVAESTARGSAVTWADAVRPAPA